MNHLNQQWRAMESSPSHILLSSPPAPILSHDAPNPQPNAQSTGSLASSGLCDPKLLCSARCRCLKPSLTATKLKLILHTARVGQRGTRYLQGPGALEPICLELQVSPLKPWPLRQT